MSRRFGIKIVSVLPRVPVDGVGAAGDVYVERYLRVLVGAGWEVSVITPATRENDDLFARRTLEVPVIVAPAHYQPPRLVRAVLGLLTGFGPIPAFLFWWGLGKAARRELRSADVVDLQFIDMIRYAPTLRRHLPRTVMVATAHDVMDQSLRRATTSPDRRVRIRAAVTRRQIARAERRGLNACDRGFVFNPENVDLLRELGVRTEVRTTPPAVDVPDSGPTPEPGAKRVLFTAAFWRSENDEAAMWFLDKVWPAVLAAVPEAKVRFAGGGPSPELLSRQGPSVEVTGFVKDLLDAYADVSVVVAPLQRGAGLKFKVVQALALGFPTVVTSVAAEGINDILSEDVLQPHDDPDSFGSAVTQTLRDAAAGGWSDVATLVRSKIDFRQMVSAQGTGYAELVRSR